MAIRTVSVSEMPKHPPLQQRGRATLGPFELSQSGGGQCQIARESGTGKRASIGTMCIVKSERYVTLGGSMCGQAFGMHDPIKRVIQR